VFTDGEFRRRNFMSDFTDAVEEFDFHQAVPRAWKDEGRRRSAAGGREQHQRHRRI